VWLGARVLGCRTCNQLRVWIPAASLSIATLGKLLAQVPVTKQYNLVPANGRWCLAAGKVTVVWRHTGHASQTLVVLHLWAQGLEEGDEHPLYALVEHGWLYLTFTVKMTYLHPVNLGSTPAGTHVSQWWRQEGHPDKIAPVKILSW